MTPNEPSRTALMVARQRAAHQVFDHGSILYEPLAMKNLREDEKDVLQFANAHPLASIGRLITTARSGLRKMLCQELSKEGFGRSSSLAPDSTLSLFGIPTAYDRSVSIRWTTRDAGMETPALG